jgi:hypothetical protein
MAEREYGREVMRRYRKHGPSANGVSEPSAVYTFGNRITRAH